MPTFVMLTRLSPATPAAESLKNMDRGLMDRVRSICPQVEWVHNYAVHDGRNTLDVFRAPDLATARKVSSLVRAGGQVLTKLWTAAEWQRLSELARPRSGGNSVSHH